AYPDRFVLDTDTAEPQMNDVAPEPADYAQDVAGLDRTGLPPWLVDVLDAAALSAQLSRILSTVDCVPGAVHFGDAAPDDGWTISRRSGRWQVRGAARDAVEFGAARDAVEFGAARDAVAYALGHVVLSTTQASGEEVFRTGQRIDPLPGDPPLTLFRDLRQLVVQPGTLLDRLGTPQGNVTYLADTPFPMRSLPAELMQQPYSVYRVHRPVEALMGEAVAWFGQPGGGSACVLPASIERLLAVRVLELI
ncbi:MAG: glycohydrolase toxin TNT-related protein, partial [Actinomycetota bacterium]|nr:glycohydrolase toxin TNT-related protein [Actinomycetota bacterium]